MCSSLSLVLLCLTEAEKLRLLSQMCFPRLLMPFDTCLLFVLFFLTSLCVYNSTSKLFMELGLLIAMLLFEMLCDSSKSSFLLFTSSLSFFLLSVFYFLRNFVAFGKGNCVAIECQMKCGNVRKLCEIMFEENDLLCCILPIWCCEKMPLPCSLSCRV